MDGLSDVVSRHNISGTLCGFRKGVANLINIDVKEVRSIFIVIDGFLGNFTFTLVSYVEGVEIGCFIKCAMKSISVVEVNLKSAIINWRCNLDGIRCGALSIVTTFFKWSGDDSIVTLFESVTPVVLICKGLTSCYSHVRCIMESLHYG